MRFIVFLLMFFILSGLFIISNNNLNMGEKKDAKEFLKLYLGWIDTFYSNSQGLTGEIIKLSWFPESKR